MAELFFPLLKKVQTKLYPSAIGLLCGCSKSILYKTISHLDVTRAGLKYVNK